MAHNSLSSLKERALILIAPGFEEWQVVYILNHIREAGKPVSLVGLSSSLVDGLHGLTVRPDCSLGQLVPDQPYTLILVPGGRQCVATLLADPRVHQLIETTLHYEGVIATMASAEEILAQTQIATPSHKKHVICQGDMEIDTFAHRLTDLFSN